MEANNKQAASKESSIQCVEVVISKNYLTDHTNNLLWTLSVYSLENQPVNKDSAIPNSEGFHFMVYDWTRTIKQLLEQNQIPYSIMGFFSLGSIYPGAVSESEVSQSFLMA